jgi:hypothetical protein
MTMKLSLKTLFYNMIIHLHINEGEMCTQVFVFYHILSALNYALFN